MDGDTVEVDSWVGVRGFEGRVVRVVSRGRAKVTGQLARAGRVVRLQPDDPRITGIVTVVGQGEHLGEAQMGQAVVAEITRYPETPDGPMEARVLRVVRVMSLLRSRSPRHGRADTAAAARLWSDQVRRRRPLAGQRG